MNNESNAALEQVAPSRRDLLAKLLAGGAAMAALPAMSSVALADEAGNGQGKGKGGKGKGADGQGKGKGGQGKGAGGGRNPQQMAAQMISKFDKDGDKALNEQELVAALTAMAQQRAERAGGQGKGGQGKGGQGKGKGAAGGKAKANP